jgi:hypothetical protein
VAETRLLTLADQLEALLAQVPPSEFSTTDNRYSTAEGAKFNMELARINGTEVHNPFLAEALLLASIVQVQEDYGLAPTQPMSLESRLTPPPSLLKLQSSD